jgi:hypothetical protein
MFSRHRYNSFTPPPPGATTFVFEITENTFDFNALFRTNGVMAGTPEVVIRINTGVIVAALSSGTPAMDLSGFLNPGSRLTLINNGFILGHGGDGGNGANTYTQRGDPNRAVTTGRATPGHDGGDALVCPGAGVLFTIQNGAGFIWGGGGGGGGGAAAMNLGGHAAGGGGGGGSGGGKHGTGSYTQVSGSGDGQDGSTGINGSPGGGGAGFGDGGGIGSNGGNGGDWGDPGGNGGLPAGLGFQATQGAGGAGGKAIDLNGMVLGGDFVIPSGFGAPNIKGSIA